MEVGNKFILDLAEPTDIRAHRGKIVSFLKLQLSGSGKIFSCVLSFFNKGESPENAASIKLVKPDFSGAQTLVPNQGSCLLILDYDFCTITDIIGDLGTTDNLFVELKQPGLA